MDKEKIQWQPIIELSIVLFTILGTTIPLYLHTDAKLDAYQSRTSSQIEANQIKSNEILNAIRQDMKDFHQEIKDFHGRLCAIEERNKK